MQSTPAPDAGVPLHHLPTKKNHGRKQKKKPATAEAAAATRVRTNPRAAAASIYDRKQIEEYCRLTKPHSTNPGGLARTLHRSGEEDNQITAWLRAKADRAKIELAQAERAQQEQLNRDLDTAEMLIKYGIKDDNDRALAPFIIESLSAYPEWHHVTQQLKGLSQ